jgi:hypothetical protein
MLWTVAGAEASGPSAEIAGITSNGLEELGGVPGGERYGDVKK